MCRERCSVEATSAETIDNRSLTVVGSDEMLYPLQSILRGVEFDPWWNDSQHESAAVLSQRTFEHRALPKDLLHSFAPEHSSTLLPSCTKEQSNSEPDVNGH